MKRLLSADENGLPSWKRLSLSLKRPATHLQKPPQQFGPLMSKEDCVAGLLKESDSLFYDGELFLSADSSLFMVHKPPEVQDSK